MSFKGGWLNIKEENYTQKDALLKYVLRLADDALITGQRLAEWCSKGPVLEQDIALSNMALDHIGRARLLYKYAADLVGDGKTEDDFAYLRDTPEFQNFLIIEQQNGHWGDTIARLFCIDTFNFYLFDKLTRSADAQLAGIAQKAIKEITYHAQWSAEWVIRLGDGTAESHKKMQASLNEIWQWTGELFEVDQVERMMAEAGIGCNPESLKDTWNSKINQVLEIATLQRPVDCWMQTGGRKGVHTEHLGFMLAEMQFLPRAYPNATW
jgi:ring-1,2-phenylacetyl-CoA epoxidase subunit PaaC